MRGVIGAAIGAAITLAVFGLFEIGSAWIGRDITPPSDQPAGFEIEAASFGELPNWPTAAADQSLSTFRRSCSALTGKDADAPMLARPHPAHPDLQALYGNAGDWQGICRQAASIEASDFSLFLEAHFAPFRLHYDIGEDALATGYFEPSYTASRTATPDHSAPVLTRPNDLVMVELGAFRENLRGQRIAGLIRNGRLLPYADSAGLADAAPETSQALGYLNPNDLLFLQIQGSGKLVFEDGEVRRVGYAAQNGHPYVAVGRTLVREGHLPLEDITMQSIHQWLMAADPADAARVRHSNPSYVFFTALEDLDAPELGPLGAQGVQLTPMSSLAIDPRFYPYGAPMWFSTQTETELISGFAVAQDTGGAIRGAQRADIFFGSDAQAADAAGRMKSQIDLFVLVPRVAEERFQHEAN